MKINLLLAALLTVASTAFAQQAPLYLIYDEACMNKLDYKYRVGNANLLSTFSLTYSGGSQLLLLDVGLENRKQFSSVPKQAIRCNAIPNPSALAAQINGNTRKVYIVRKRSTSDYAITPVASATWVNEGSGQVQVNGFGYSFRLDLQTTDFAKNISLMKDSSYIFLKSLGKRDCKQAFTFNYGPNRTSACGEASALTFISGLGFVSEDNSICETDKQINGIDLVAVNGKSVDRWLEEACKSALLTQAVPTAPIERNGSAPKPVLYNVSAKQAKTAGKPVPETDFTEMIPGTQPPVVVTSEPIGPPLQPVYCSAVSGNGRHIVNRGETLYAISRKYQVPVKQLIAWNKIKNPNQIQPCQEILIEAPKADVAKVASGKATQATVASIPTKKKAEFQPTSVAKPVQHNETTQPEPNSPVVYYVATEMTAKEAPSAPTKTAAVMHTVTAGESLYGLAKRYGYSTERFALMNGLNTDAVLKPGQVLLTTDCTCPVERAASAESLRTSEAVLTSKSPVTRPSFEATEQAYYKQPVTHSASTETSALSYENRNAATPDVVEVPSNYEYEKQQVVETTEVVTAQPETYSTAAPVRRSTIIEYYTEVPIKTHVVGEGDSLGSIAMKYKTTIGQLRSWNQLEPNEVIVNGQLLIVQK